MLSQLNQQLSEIRFSEQQVYLFVVFPILLSLVFWRLSPKLFLIYLLSSVISFIMVGIILDVLFLSKISTTIVSTQSFFEGFLLSQIFSTGFTFYLQRDVKNKAKLIDKAL